jgi:hypothetical protein
MYFNTTMHVSDQKIKDVAPRISSSLGTQLVSPSLLPLLPKTIANTYKGDVPMSP